jgi:hypothetical protein
VAGTEKVLAEYIRENGTMLSMKYVMYAKGRVK